MKRSTKAALLSGLVFPGLGHMLLKQYRRGWMLLLCALAALSVVVTIAVRQAMAVVDRIERGEVAADAGAITELAADSISSADSSLANICLIAFIVCWLVGIIDSYRLGSKNI